jgi:hypothetical protein
MLAAGLAVVLIAAPVAAGNSYVWSVTNKRCSLGGGAWGEGYVKARVYMEENGHSGTNYFQMIFRLQEWSGSYWYVIDSKTFYTNSFPNNGATNYTVKTGKVSVADNSLWHRISVRLQWWDQRPGNDVLLYQRTVNGPYC